jgi:hypothetical protein
MFASRQPGEPQMPPGASIDNTGNHPTDKTFEPPRSTQRKPLGPNG